MPAYHLYLRKAKKREALLGAQYSALKRRGAKLTNDFRAEQERCNRLIQARKLDEAQQCLNGVLKFPDQTTAIASETEAAGHAYVKARTCTALGYASNAWR